MPRSIPLFRVDGPLMVFGGPYSNLEATLARLVRGAREVPRRSAIVGNVCFAPDK